MSREPERPSATDVVLRAITGADLPALFAFQADPVACQIAALRSRDEAAFFAHWAKTLTDATVIVRAVLFGAELVGSIGSFTRTGERCVGYWIARRYWGRGIATAALAELLRVERVRPLHAHAATQNVASIRVLETCGFVVDRYERAPADDRWEAVDEVVMVLREAPPRPQP